jgi:hypothetical protein
LEILPPPPFSETILRMISGVKIALSVGLLGVLSAAQDIPTRKGPSITLAPVPIATVTRGKAGKVALHFHIGSGFHVNSNAPKAEFLIPTTLKLDPPTDIVMGKVDYPEGDEISLPFAPDEKLSVYSGDFSLGVLVRPLVSVLPGKYEIRGQLKYQACDKAACYPPKSLPVDFEIKVIKQPSTPRANPRQSPHIHL